MTAVAGGRVPVLAKHAVERLLLASGVPAMTRLRRRRDVLVLAYHNIVPTGDAPTGDESLHLPQARFAEQLDMLAETHDVVPLASALASDARGRGRPRAVVTFDDAYRGAVTAGVTELAQRDMPATIFVAPMFVGGAAFWWDRIVRPTAEGAKSFRSRALGEACGQDDAVRELAARLGLRERDVPSHARCAAEAELNDAITRAPVTLGSHSWGHPNLATLPLDSLREELTRPIAWLRERWAGRVLPALAYPYGIVSDRVVSAAREAGYALALRIDGGWMRPFGTEPLLAPRVYVPASLSAAGFALRAAGVLAT